MKHIEITENEKVIFSADVEDIKIGQHRSVTALFKEGETKAYTIAPSNVTQTVIYYEEVIKGIKAEFITKEKIELNILSPLINLEALNRLNS